MNAKPTLPSHYSFKIGDIIVFVPQNEASGTRVVTYGKMNVSSPILQYAGMKDYRDFIHANALLYQFVIPEGNKKGKTQFTSKMVNMLLEHDYIFVNRDDKTKEYFLINTRTTEGFKMVREKVRQAMKDFLRNAPVYEFDISEFQNEGPPLPGRELMDVFDAPLEPEIEQGLDNMVDSSEEGEAYDLDEVSVKDENMDDLSFSDFPLMD